MSAGNAQIGKLAPDFTAKAVMPDLQFQDLTLSDYRGRTHTHTHTHTPLCTSHFDWPLFNGIKNHSIESPDALNSPHSFALQKTFGNHPCNHQSALVSALGSGTTPINSLFCFDYWFFLMQGSTWCSSSILWTSPLCARRRSSRSAKQLKTSGRSAVRSSARRSTRTSPTLHGTLHVSSSPLYNTL